MKTNGFEVVIEETFSWNLKPKTQRNVAKMPSEQIRSRVLKSIRLNKLFLYCLCRERPLLSCCMSQNIDDEIFFIE